LNSDGVRHVVQGTINSNLKPTPLQWACFKSQIPVVNILLKYGLKLEDIDQFGNDCVHLSAAGGNYDVFEILMAFGVTVDRLNTRYIYKFRQHSCRDLATNP
jgi:ankyrin repeat protein